jgi:hypothetical protein
MLKAIANGLPVIATRHSGVALGPRDRFVDFGGADDLEKAILDMLPTS